MIEQTNGKKLIHVCGLSSVPEIILKTFNAVEAKERVKASVIDFIDSALNSVFLTIKYENVYRYLYDNKIFHVLIDHRSEKTEEIVRNLNTYGINVLYYKDDQDWGYLSIHKDRLTYDNTLVTINNVSEFTYATLDTKTHETPVDPVRTIDADGNEWVQDVPLFLSPDMVLHLYEGGLIRMAEEGSRTVLQMLNSRGNEEDHKEGWRQYLTEQQIPRQVVNKNSDVVIVKDYGDHTKIESFLEKGLVPVACIRGTWYYYRMVAGTARSTPVPKEMLELNNLTNQ